MNLDFETVWLEQQEYITRIIRKLAWGSRYIEDIKSNVAIRLLQYLGTFKGQSKFSTWLYTLVKNEVYYFQRQETQHIINKNYLESSVIFADSREVLHRIEARSTLTAMLNITRRIMRDKNSVKFLVLHCAGYENKELAKQNNYTLPGIKSAIHRARVAFKESEQVLEGKTTVTKARYKAFGWIVPKYN